MTILATVFVPEGIVMAVDSRMTINMPPQSDGTKEKFVLTDNAQKIFFLKNANMGISCCGELKINGLMISEFIERFDSEIIPGKETVECIANNFLDHVNKRNLTGKIAFHLCGYQEQPYVYVIEYGKLSRRNTDNESKLIYSMIATGETMIINNLLYGKDFIPIPYTIMPIRDAIDFCAFLVEVVIRIEAFGGFMAACGGPIDILLLTKGETLWIKHKVFNP